MPFIFRIVAIVEGDTGLRVQPSHPSFRLWADSHAALMGAGVVREPSVAHPKKARFLARSAGEFCPEPRDVGKVYFLGDDTDAGVVFTDLPPADALIALVKHSFLLDIQANELLASHFDRLSRLVQRERCFRLDYPR